MTIQKLKDKNSPAQKTPNEFKLINSEIRLEPTNLCNSRCIMCPREKMKRAQGIMDMDLYKKIMDQAVDAGADKVSLENYGEAFLDPYIFERAEYARSKGLKTFTITNGSLFDEEKCQKTAELFDKIRISMYGITKATFESIHKGIEFEQVEANVARLFKVRNETKDSSLKIEMYFLLMDQNKHELKSWLDKYEKIADAASIWKPHNWSDGRTYRKPHGKKISCNRPFVGPLQVQWDGMVVPCCFDYDSRMILGDLNRESLYEVMSGTRYNELRKAHREGDFSKFPFCNTCDQLNKKDDVLVYTTIKDAKVGATNTAYFALQK